MEGIEHRLTRLTVSQPKKRGSKKKAVQAPLNEIPPSTHCPLLDLAAELRNNIYEQVLDDSDYRGVGAVICFEAPNNLSSECGLVRANKQIREEFLSVSSHGLATIVGI